MHRRRFRQVLACSLPAIIVAVAASCQPTRFESDAAQREEAAAIFPAHIREPACPTVATGLLDEMGQPIRVACATCHTTRPANAEARVGTPLKSFHQGQVGKHGNLTCISCHNANDGYASLRLADGQSVPYAKVMQLCAQCHGPQFRDYEHGAHGGMNGYWDLSKGSRTKNNCIDCHDPHAPKYPTVMPARGPNDRFLGGVKHE